MTKEKFTEHIKRFDFQNLFIELGWDHESASGSLISGEKSFVYKIVAKLQGFFVIVISSAEQDIPASSLRKQISTKLSQTYPENLLIFHGTETQYWSYRVQVDSGKERYTETAFSIDKEADALFQRASGLFFRLDEYDMITFVDVKSKVRKGFSVNYDAVTKKFYDHFKKEHESFKKAIEGIVEDSDLDWYTSVTLNRLMFCYFIQKKGFLDNDTNYLQKKLQLFMEREEETGFYSFYLEFLMVLFHDGLGGRERDHEKRALLGSIPYLNGGMFEVHELEQKYGGIKINNNAFKEIFDFFDRYKWHLDINPDAPGNEINPDVLGYIFEKYINQRAEMGAYYTKEDITGYIGKNTILPFLFDEVKRKYPDPFKENGEVWRFLRESGDEFIYPSIKHGIPVQSLGSPDSEGLFNDLPDEIKTGLNPEQKDLWKIRKPWNKPAPAEIALPTEIYREVIERRNRYKDVKRVIVSGRIKEINDLITYNLDIINFTEDLLTNTEDPKLVEHFYKAIEKVTILDPTCGSGAFLFAAMNILEPLYEILIERMRSFVFDEDRINAEKYASRKGGFLYKYPYFREVLGKISGLKDPDDPDSGQNHPSQKYFILKSIILNNLYGVDIMREAVEIAKLRLFLKLVAQVHPDPNEENLGIEPLPDMDFNLKTGNTLVGFGGKSEIEALSAMWVSEEDKSKIFTECDVISLVFERFKEEQLTGGETTLLKLEIKKRIEKLNEQLNQLFYHAHYVGWDYDHWQQSHLPFHWFAEFYKIFNQTSGFNVVIGNPPYVEYTKVKKHYQVVNFQSLTSNNLYAFVIERSLNIMTNGDYLGMILPASAFCTDRMNAIQEILMLESGYIWTSHYAERPGKLFEGAERNLTIAIASLDGGKDKSSIYSSSYIKWISQTRPILFQLIDYWPINDFLLKGIFPKIGNTIEAMVLKKLRLVKANLGESTVAKNDNVLYYRNSGGRYWKINIDFQPLFYINGNREISSRESYLYFNSRHELQTAVALLNSTLFFWYYIVHSDARTNNPSDLKGFPVALSDLSNEITMSLREQSKLLMASLQSNSEMITANLKTGKAEFQKFVPAKSKHLIDEIDAILADYFGFSEDELDHIIHYDLKYRLSDEFIDE